MKIAIISARYTDEYTLDEFFARVFGYGNASVTPTRGRYQCILPRGLTPAELETLKAMEGFQHYKEL